MSLMNYKKSLRKILVRGQTRKKGEKVWINGKPVEGNWEYGRVLQGDGDFSIIYALDFSKIPMNEENIGKVKFKEKSVVHTDTLGQYIGLTDKNKRMIFEDDIVKSPFGDIGVVEYSKLFGKWQVQCGNSNILDFEGIDSFYFEVIGNIHDNPELLKKNY